VKIRRAALVANVVIMGTTIPITALPTVTVTSSDPALYQFADTGASPLPWAASNVESYIARNAALGTPHAISDDGITALAVRESNNDLGLYQRNASGTTSFTDVSATMSVPAPGDDPIPFFDPSHNVDLAYVSTTGALVVLSSNAVLIEHGSRLHSRSSAPFSVSVLTGVKGVGFTVGDPSVLVQGTVGTLVARTTAGDAIDVSLTWGATNQAPSLASPVDVTAATATGTLLGDPVTLNDGTTDGLFAAVTTTGAVEVYAQHSPGAWTATNLTAADGAPASNGQLTGSSNGLTTYLAALSASGHVELFSHPAASVTPSSVSPRVIVNPTPSWTYQDVTNATSGAPSFNGAIYLSATATQLTVAGQAAGWGNLYALTSPLPTFTWDATDVSLTSTNSSRTIGPGVSGATIDGVLTLFALSLGVTAPQGVGVYAIPQSDNTQAIDDGWTILSDTGGLGTTAAPWVGFTTSGGVAQSPDFLLGQAIQNAHKPITWLSFWTVSGPMPGQALSAPSFYAHGYNAGKWVATQIDAYAANGLSLKPNWVILDPEGYPDNHSALDPPGGASAAVKARYPGYWAAILKGWAAGLAAVDPTINAAVYAEMSQYRDDDLATIPMSVFEAIAFPGPLQIEGSTGANVRGYIAFGASCTPPTTLQNEIATLLRPPWSGQYNTLQFNAGVYCAP